MGISEFDSMGFFSDLDSVRQSRQLTWKKVAEKAEISASTLTRMAQGKRPDVDSLAALVAWSGLSADNYVDRKADIGSDSDSLAQVTALLRADPNLSKEAAIAMDAVVKATYERLRNTE